MRAGIRWVGVAIAVAVAASAASWAFIPPSQFIVRTIAAKRSAVKFARIRSIVSELVSDRATGTQFKETTLYDGVNHVLVSWAADEAGREIYVAERRAVFPTVDALLFDNRPADLVQLLKSKDLPIRSDDDLLRLKDEDERRAAETETFARWKGDAVWVIGARDKFQPQLWVDKSSFTPVRLIAPNRDGDLMEYRFENFRYSRDFAFPRSVTLVKKNGDTLLRDEVTDFAVEGEADPKEERMFHSHESEEFTPAGGSVSGSVRSLIKLYYGNLR